MRHYLTTPSLAYTFIPTPEPERWELLFAYGDMRRVEDAAFTVGNRTYAVFGLVGRSPSARAQSMPGGVDILNYALTLESLEESYYRQDLDASTSGGPLISGDARTIYGKIADHEAAHVTVLADAVDSTGGTPVEFSDSDFDSTAGGTFDPFNDYATYLLLSQAFEDTGVWAYKGQARFLAGNDLLTPALQIHSVEARHAAEVRRLRAVAGASIKPWIPGTATGVPRKPCMPAKTTSRRPGSTRRPSVGTPPNRRPKPTTSRSRWTRWPVPTESPLRSSRADRLPRPNRASSPDPTLVGRARGKTHCLLRVPVIIDSEPSAADLIVRSGCERCRQGAASHGNVWGDREAPGRLRSGAFPVLLALFR